MIAGCSRCRQLADGDGRIYHENACSTQGSFRQRGTQFFIVAQSYLEQKAPGYQIDDYVKRAHENPRQVFLFELDGDPHTFISKLPTDWRPPTQKHPSSGLPPNVWVGAMASSWRLTDLVFDKLVDVRARVRFLIHESLDEKRLAKLFDSWRCSNCGHRGPAPMPQRCPHANALCGDAKLEPQIHWFIKRRPITVKLEEELHRRGVVIWPDVPNVHGVTV